MRPPVQGLSMSRHGGAGAAMFGGAVALAVVLAAAPELIGGVGLSAPHAPDFAAIAAETLPVQLHLAAALGALFLGTALMAGPKGRTWHKRLGWTYAGLMLITALSSLLIRRQNDGDLSFIHALSGWTIVTLPLALVWARRKNIKRHRRSMMGLFFGGLILAGLLAFLPGRLMWTVFFG